MFPTQLLILGLPILPEALDRYFSAKIKQYIVTPVSNFITHLLFLGFKTFLLHFMEAVHCIAQAVLGALNTVYNDIIYMLALILWSILWFLAYVTWTLEWSAKTKVNIYNIIASLIYTVFMCVRAIPTYIQHSISQYHLSVHSANHYSHSVVGYHPNI